MEVVIKSDILIKFQYKTVIHTSIFTTSVHASIILQDCLRQPQISLLFCWRMVTAFLIVYSIVIDLSYIMYNDSWRQNKSKSKSKSFTAPKFVFILHVIIYWWIVSCIKECFCYPVLEIKCSYLPGTDLWGLNSEVVNMNWFYWVVQSLASCTSVHTNTCARAHTYAHTQTHTHIPSTMGVS
jgi:hypothetical protein